MNLCVQQLKPERLQVIVNDCGTEARVIASQESINVSVATNTSTVSGGSLPYQHIQITANATWIITHNKGYKTITKAFTPGGVEYDCDIQNINDNITHVVFDQPEVGYSITVP